MVTQFPHRSLVVGPFVNKEAALNECGDEDLLLYFERGDSLHVYAPLKRKRKKGRWLSEADPCSPAPETDTQCLLPQPTVK